MDHFPIFLTVRGRRVVIVGDDASLAPKVALLQKAGAELCRLSDPGADDLRGCAAVFVATGDAARDEATAQAAQAAGVLVNVVDRPELSTFIMPAIVDRDPVVVAISTNGTSPVLARRLRERLEALLPRRLGDLARFAGRFRGAVQGVLAEPASRRRFWEEFIDGPLAARVLAGDDAVAPEMAARIDRARRAA